MTKNNTHAPNSVAAGGTAIGAPLRHSHASHTPITSTTITGATGPFTSMPHASASVPHKNAVERRRASSG